MRLMWKPIKILCSASRHRRAVRQLPGLQWRSSFRFRRGRWSQPVESFQQLSDSGLALSTARFHLGLLWLSPAPASAWCKFVNQSSPSPPPSSSSRNHLDLVFIPDPAAGRGRHLFSEATQRWTGQQRGSGLEPPEFVGSGAEGTLSGRQDDTEGLQELQGQTEAGRSWETRGGTHTAVLSKAQAVCVSQVRILKFFLIEQGDFVLALFFHIKICMFR